VAWRLVKDMPEQSATPDLRIARIAARQHGVVSIHQLREAGLSNQAVSERRQAGRLHRLHRGVYAVGHVAPSNERRWMAAVLALTARPVTGHESARAAGAVGNGAVLSHRSAAALWGLLPARHGPVDVSVPRAGGRRRRQGIRVHRCVSLQPGDMTRRQGIPVTAPARTLADLGPVVPARERRRAVRQAEVLGLPVGSEVEIDGTRSELEYEFLRLCRRHRLPEPAVNVKLGRLTVDFLWSAQRLVVETDGYRYHRGSVAFEDDHSRDLELRARGYEVRRFSYRQVVREPQRVVAELRRDLRPPDVAPSSGYA
jgi:very-short-patch-repair endonuclease